MPAMTACTAATSLRSHAGLTSGAKIFDLHERSPTPLTTDILARIGALYAVEAEVRGQPPDARHRARQD